MKLSKFMVVALASVILAPASAQADSHLSERALRVLGLSDKPYLGQCGYEIENLEDGIRSGIAGSVRWVLLEFPTEKSDCLKHLLESLEENWKEPLPLEFFFRELDARRFDLEALSAAYLIYWKYGLDDGLDVYFDSIEHHLKGDAGMTLRHQISYWKNLVESELESVERDVLSSGHASSEKYDRGKFGADIIMDWYMFDAGKFFSYALRNDYPLALLDTFKDVCSWIAGDTVDIKSVNRSLEIVDRYIENNGIFDLRGYEHELRELADLYAGCSVPSEVDPRVPRHIPIAKRPEMARKYLDIANFSSHPDQEYISRLSFHHYMVFFDRGIGFERNPKIASKFLLAPHRAAALSIDIPADGFYDHVSRETIAHAQRTLKDLGYYTASIDGIPGPGFRSAIVKLARYCVIRKDIVARWDFENYSDECPMSLTLSEVGLPTNPFKWTANGDPPKEF